MLTDHRPPALNEVEISEKPDSNRISSTQPRNVL